MYSEEYSKLHRVIAYLIYKYYKTYKRGLDRLKLMKLLFLVDYDISEGSVRPRAKEHISGVDNWIIYLWGPFSYDVYQAKDKLIREGFIYEDVETKALIPEGEEKLKEIAEELNRETKETIDKVVETYGIYDSIDLTYMIYKALKLTPLNKEKYFGKPVSEYLKQNKEDKT